MKKLFAALFVAAAVTFGAFAQDTLPSGTWVDKNYNAEWVIGVDGSITIRDASSGEVYKKFSPLTQNFKFSTSLDGLTLTFRCNETSRTYKITKGISASADLTLAIERDWTDEPYEVTIKFKN